MRINRILIISFFMGLLVGCAANPEKMYAEISQSDRAVAYDSVDVIKKASAIELPKTIHGMSFKRESFHITAEDPVIDFGDYKSNYKLFAFHLNANDTFRISVMSLCQCLGFDKRILVPKTYVIDEQASPVAIESSERMDSLGSISYGIKGKVSQTGTYYLVVAANNSSLGSGVSTEETMMDGYKPTGIMISNKSNPYGKVMVSYEVLAE